MGRTVVVLLLCGCAELDPWSWDLVTCAEEIPADADDAHAEAMQRLDDAGAVLSWEGERAGINAQTLSHGTWCEVTFYEGWDDLDVDLVAVPLHEAVHCEQPPGGTHFEREIPAIRQELQALRAQGWSDEQIQRRATNLLRWWGWLTADNLAALTANCGEA